MFELPATTSWQPLRLPQAHAGRLQAHGNNTTYRIFLHKPAGPAPPDGFPVVYLLDGGDLFAGVSELLRRASRRPESTGIAPAILVGIGHPNAADDTVRRRDYTPGPCATESIPGPTGGADAFVEFITGQLAPMIEQGAPIDHRRRGLLGHSLAGYCCLRALATQAAAFSHFAAISPSLWWDPAAVQPPSESPGAHSYLAAGEWEADPAPWQQRLAADAAGLAHRRRRDMVGQARELARRLADRWPDSAARFDLLAGEDHATVVLPAITRALRFMQQTRD